MELERQAPARGRTIPLFYVIYLICVAASLAFIFIACAVVRGLLAEYEGAQPKYVAAEAFEAYFAPIDYTLPGLKALPREISVKNPFGGESEVTFDREASAYFAGPAYLTQWRCDTGDHIHWIVVVHLSQVVDEQDSDVVLVR